MSLTADWIATALKLNPRSDVVLDVGCDSAVVSRFVAPHCRHFIGVDFISAMLEELKRRDTRTGVGHHAWFAAADGKHLPFPSGVFSKSYCSDVIHTLPDHDDALRIIRELVRVCRPGGEVLITSIPDVRKRFQGRLMAFRTAGLSDKVKIVVHLLVPQTIKNVLRRILRMERRDHLDYLEFDLRRLRQNLDKEGLKCEIVDFPKNYWSTDYRKTRSNLIICIPQS